MDRVEFGFIWFNPNCIDVLPMLSNGLPGLFFAMLPYVEQTAEGCCLTLDKYIKSQLANQLELSESRIDHVIADLVKADVLQRINRGTYRINNQLVCGRKM